MNKVLIIGFIGVCQCLLAQTPDSIKDLPAEQVEVIKQFEARLEDAKKVNTIPEPPAQRVLEQFQYTVGILPLELEYPEPNIRPLGMPKEELPSKFNGLIHVGAGNINTLDAGLHYNYITSMETEINLNADYLTQDNNKERFQERQQINTDLQIRHSFNELLTFDIGGGYDQEDVGFYGSPLPLGEIQDTSIYKRRIAEYGFGFKVFNAAENEYDLDYRLGLDYKNVNLVDENLVENDFLVDLMLRKGLNEKFDLSLDGKMDISSILDTSTFSYNNYHIKPGISYHSEKFGFDAAVDFAFGPLDHYYLPDLELSFSPSNYAFIPYIFWKSNLQKNNLDAIINYNPFISKEITPDLRNTIHHRYGLGAKGKYKGFQYEISGAYGSVDHLLMFRNHVNEDGLRQFLIETDNSQVWDVKVDIQYNLSDQLSVGSHFNYIYYDIVAWHIPSYTFEIHAEYLMLDKKLAISPSLFIRDGVIVVNDDREAEELPYMLDFNLRSTYQVTEQMGVFAEINNILASEYQQWYDYSNFGLNAKAGIQIKF